MHHVPEEYGVGLQEAFIEQTVDTFLIAVNRGSNCHKFNMLSVACCPLCVRSFLCGVKPCVGCKTDPRGIVLRWCNAPDYVRVAMSDRNGIEKAHMRGDLKFEQETWQGKFDCVAIVDAVAQKARTEMVNKLKEVTKAKVLEAEVSCPHKEVTGSCPNDACTYRPGMCFRGQQDSGYYKGN